MTFSLPPQYGGTAYIPKEIFDSEPRELSAVPQRWGEDSLLLLGLIALLWIEGAESGVIALLIVLLLCGRV